MKDRRKIIVTTLLLICILGLVAFKISSSLIHNNLVENKKAFSGTLSDPTLGEWTVTNEWVDLSTNNNVDIDNGNAIINATVNDISKNEITYRMNVEYEGGTATGNFLNTADYEGFIMYWEINRFPFSTRDSDISTDSYVWNEDPNNNRIIVEKRMYDAVCNGIDDTNDDCETVAYIYFNDLVNKSKRKNEQFAWRLNKNQWPYAIEIYNAAELDSASSIDTNFDVTFQVLPSFIYDNEYNSESFEPTVFLELGSYNVQDIDKDSTTNYHAKINGKLAIENVVKADPIVYEEWQNSWGTNPGGGNYFYVLYSVDASINSTKPFNTDPNLYVTLPISYPNGELVAYSDGRTMHVGNEMDYIDDDNYDVDPLNGWNFSTYALLSNEVPSTTDFTRTYVVRYPKPSSGEVTTNFSLTIEATGKDENTPVQRTVSWTATYVSSGISTPTYPSGYNNNITVEYDDTSTGVGAVNKLSNSDVDFSLFIEPTSAEMNKLTSEETVKAFNNWNATNEGANSYTLEVSTSKTVLDSTYDSVTSEQLLTNSDYNIVSISPTITKYDYNLYNDRYYLAENNSDATGTLKLYGEINGTWTELGLLTIDATGLNYTANNTNTVSVTGVSTTNPIILPNNTTNTKVVYTGTKAAVYIGLNINLKLLTTAKTKVNSIYNNYNSVVLRQYGVSKVNNSLKDTKSKDMNLTKLDSQSTITHTSTKTKNSNSNTISYESKITESIDYNTTTSAISYSSIKEQKNAKFYVLLPQGSTLVDNSITVKDINDNVIAVTSSPQASYQSTNRELITITINNTNANTKVQSNKLVSGYTLNYQIDYPHTSNRDYGNTVKSDLAYFSENTITDGYSNASNANNNLFSATNIKTAFSNLGTKESSYLFKNNTITVDPVATSLGTLKTQVKNTVDSTHKDSTTVKIGNTYQYKLEYSYSDPLTEMSNLVMYTSLENAYGNNSYWQGTLSSVDTSVLQALGINYTIYYSEKSNLDLSIDRNLDVTRTDTWTSDTPVNMANVKAIAIDCSATDFIGVKIPIVYLNMIASLNRNDINKSAYNNSVITFTTLGESKKITSNTASIKLEDTNVSLDVVPKESINGAEYNKGTETTYVSINSTLGYLYHITNSDEVGYNNVNVNTKISNNLTINQSSIKYYTDINNIHSLDSSITYTNTNNTIDLNITNLAANTNLYIFIPVQIDAANLTEENSKFTTVSSITKISNKAFNTTEIKTYNRANIPSISATHSTKTAYNNNVFSSTDTYVNKGETITNMIKVTNDADVEAKNITVIETLPSGVTVDGASITNGGVHSGNKITWSISSIAPSDSLELTYNMTIPANPNNNTYFTPSTKVEMLNPYDANNKIVDRTLEYGTIVYRNVTDFKITNSAEGVLANKNKDFNYTLEITASPYAKGTYTPQYTINGNTRDANALTIGDDGKATYTFTMKDGGELLITNIPGGYNVKITQQTAPGYTTTIKNRTISNMGIEDTVDENTNEHLRSYEFLNTYSATGSFTPTAKVTYDQDLEANMFEVKMNDVISTNDVNGSVSFPTINYNNEVGTYNYVFTETRGTNERILYDSVEYTAVVNVTDNGAGRLVTDVNIYDATGAKKDEIVFNNKYIKVGLLIKNNNTGDYINTSKEFNYKISVSSATPSTTYKVINQNDEELTELEIDDTGSGTYEISLRHNEYIVIEELPVGSNYTIEEQTEEFYTSTIEGSETPVEEGILRTSGTITLTTTQVIFNNQYSTEANFAPKANIVLKDKELENNEFLFMITDTSDGITNGYSEVVKNDADGNIYFSNITYTRPGVYTYEIQQLSSDNPNIILDNNKLLLTLVLEDNGDGTMKVTSTYKYLNGSSNFVNQYSELPIIDEEVKHDLNPNTDDKTIYMLLIGLLAIVFITIGRIVNIRKYNKI